MNVLKLIRRQNRAQLMFGAPSAFTEGLLLHQMNGEHAVLLGILAVGALILSIMNQRIFQSNATVTVTDQNTFPPVA
jgi:hypothetical protein